MNTACRLTIAAAAALLVLAAGGSAAEEATAPKGLREASYYHALGDGSVACDLCPNRCVIREGKRGLCRVRENRGGKLYSLVYGTPCAAHVDPIEKKPFFHVLPGTLTYSIATVGCNMRCIFCQNWQISQASPEEAVVTNMTPAEVVRNALKEDCASIAFTYTEPTIFYEYMRDIAGGARDRGVACVMHTCGYINAEPLKELSPYLLAVDVDLKSFDDAFYRKMGLGDLKSVLETLKILKNEGVWIEITNLLIPGENDSEEEIRTMCRWIIDNLGTAVPLHFSRFQPNFKLRNLPATTLETLERARDTALSMGLEYVYVGNVPGHPGENTYCPKCKKMAIERIGYRVLADNVVDGKCRFCGYEIKGRWSTRR